MNRLSKIVLGAASRGLPGGVRKRRAPAGTGMWESGSDRARGGGLPYYPYYYPRSWWPTRFMCSRTRSFRCLRRLTTGTTAGSPTRTTVRVPVPQRWEQVSPQPPAPAQAPTPAPR